MRELHYAYNWMTAAFVPSAAQLERYHASEAERIRILNGEPPPDTSAELERLTAEMEARRKTGAKVMKRICDMSVGTVYKNMGNHPPLLICSISDGAIFYNYATPSGTNSHYTSDDWEAVREIISEPTPEVGDTVQCLDDKDAHSALKTDGDYEVSHKGQYDFGSITTSPHKAIVLASVAGRPKNCWWPERSLRIIKKKGM